MHKDAWLLNRSNVSSLAVKLVLKQSDGGRCWEGDACLEPPVNYQIPGLPVTVPRHPCNCQPQELLLCYGSYLPGTQSPGMDANFYSGI